MQSAQRPFLPPGIAEFLRGAPFFPVHGRDAGDKWKRPAVRNWKQFQTTFPAPDDVAKWDREGRLQPGKPWALVTGKVSGVFVLDFDGEEGRALYHEKFPDPGSAPLTAATPSGGYHAFFEYDESGGPLTVGVKTFPGLDYRGEGGYIVAPESEHGREWLTSVLFPGERLPSIPEWFRAALKPSSCEKTVSSSNPPDKPRAVPKHSFDRMMDGFQLCSALARIRSRAETEHHLDHDERLAVANYSSQFVRGREWAIKNIFGLCSDFDETYTSRMYASLNGIPPRCDGGGLCGGREKCEAIQRSGGRSPIQFAFLPRPLGTAPVLDGAPSERMFEEMLGDIENGERFVRQWGDQVRFCPPRKLWYQWDGKRWAPDTTGTTLEKAKLTARSIFVEAAKETDKDRRNALVKHATKTDSEKRLRSMLAMAASRLVVLPSEFDGDGWLFNVANGTIDLRTGALLPHDRGNMISKISPIRYVPDAPAPRFHNFLAETFPHKLDGGGDDELISWVHRACGYSLTGDKREQCFFIMEGSGRNGKSTLTDALLAIFGEYGAVLPVSALLTDPSQAFGGADKPRNDIAALPGVRFAVASEPPEGKWMDETLIKAFTGDGLVNVRKNFEQGFTFEPITKIWLTTNHRPKVHGTDNGIWRRVRLVPFAAQITEEQEDQELAGKLAAEYEGILAWLVRGCLQWQQDGLRGGVAVSIATQDYRRTEDVFREFFEWAFVKNPQGSFQFATAWNVYRSYCREHGLREKSSIAFSKNLERMGAVWESRRLWGGYSLSKEALERNASLANMVR